jgi:hypothetical protein
MRFEVSTVFISEDSYHPGYDAVLLCEWFPALGRWFKVLGTTHPTTHYRISDDLNSFVPRATNILMF